MPRRSLRAARWGLRAIAAIIALGAVACGGAQEPPEPHGPLRIAAGSDRGVYSVYGGALAHLAGERLPGTAASALATVGSVENIQLVTSGRAEAGFALADVAADAVAGRAPFDGRRRIRALAWLYDNYVQLVVRDHGPVRDLAGLAGKRVSIGAPGSGTAIVGERILKIAGLWDRVSLRRLEIAPSAEALGAGEIDAFFWSGGLPSAAITDLRATMGVRLIDLGPVAADLTERYGELYAETVVPASVYGLAGAVTSVSVPNYLIVRDDLPEATGYWLTRILFEEQPRLAEIHPEARRLDPGAAIMTYPLELHPGAIRWYRSQHR
ncbi:TAXI family TRAP transporter solute-binding subunit [Spongiactinospora sp. TRM90649]|uniref:TAXI family TRAP transporter solute-binding subunit n=1 Tax=Spongiactinospora sp. TRM90649 TaxID=3031114 RepID=UPI0023F6CF7E|nr:TAXI family TRAP transporter solute-binding subunit [Spongiactinospora sp. TRM90649]MDF5755848.1 TAXI family TRAP transporter solute-binding subunit [Spongiactinospora sp. TRM90649]